MNLLRFTAVVKEAGILRKGPGDLHLDFLKTITKNKMWKKDPNGLSTHPRKDYFKLDKAEIRTAAVSPLIRASGTESPSNGKDVQVPLSSNPYRLTVNPAEGDAKNAEEYENGYQFCQGLGHQGLNAATSEQIDSWSTRPQAWRDGFAAAASTLGVPGIDEAVNATPKVAKLAAIRVAPGLFPQLKNIGKTRLFTASNPNKLTREFPQARHLVAQEDMKMRANDETTRIIRKKEAMVPRALNYLAGGTGFGVGADLAARQSMTGLNVNDIPEDEMMPVRTKGRALGAIGAGLLGGLGALGLAWSEHDPSEWLSHPLDTAKNMASGSTVGILGGLVPPAIYSNIKTKELLDDEVARRNKAIRDAQRPADNVAGTSSALTTSMAS